MGLRRIWSMALQSQNSWEKLKRKTEKMLKALS
jgi:hypothetical protein